MTNNSVNNPTKNDLTLYRQQFNKIILLSYMALDIAAFAESKGSNNLIERLDLTCGAIPAGDFEDVIDPSAPDQFLELYTHVAEFRFAFSVTELLRINTGFIDALNHYCYDKGKSLAQAKLTSVNEAFDYMNAFVLDGIPSNKTREIIEQTEKKIVWKKLNDTHEEFWTKAGCTVDVYYQLQAYFVNGLFEASEIKFLNDKNETFTICF